MARTLLWMMAGLTACGAPISNAPFTEEPDFVDVLLMAEDVAPPAPLEAIEVDEQTAPLLQQALFALTSYRDFVALPVAISDQLRTVGPSERTGQRRGWAPTTLVVPVVEGEIGGQRLETLWVQADVVKIDERRFEARVDVAEAESGPFETVGTGVDDGEGEAQWRWELGAVVDVLGLDVGGPVETLELAIDPDGAEGERQVDARYGTGPVFGTIWLVRGQTVFAFNGRFGVTTDDLSWPGELVVRHTEDGGIATGEVAIAEDRVAFGSCWDARGRGVWQGGDDTRLLVAGDAQACPVTFD